MWQIAGMEAENADTSGDFGSSAGCGVSASCPAPEVGFSERAGDFDEASGLDERGCGPGMEGSAVRVDGAGSVVSTGGILVSSMTIAPKGECGYCDQRRLSNARAEQRRRDKRKARLNV